MGTTSRRVFLDTSVVFAAVLSETGGARRLFQLGELGVIQLVIGPNVLQECEAVVRRKTPGSIPTLAVLLELGSVEVSGSGAEAALERARQAVAYPPDAFVLAEAISAETDWFVSHDKVHFLRNDLKDHFPFRIGTPGDLIQALSDEFLEGGTASLR